MEGRKKMLSEARRASQEEGRRTGEGKRRETDSKEALQKKELQSQKLISFEEDSDIRAKEKAIATNMYQTHTKSISGAASRRSKGLWVGRILTVLTCLTYRPSVWRR